MSASFQFIQETVQAEAYGPVIIAPYNEESLKKINRSFTSIQSYKAKVMADRTSLVDAAKRNASNPTPENNAALIEKTGKVINTNVNLLNESEAALGKAIPEIKKYKQYLRKMIKNMEVQSGNTLISEQVKWAQAAVRALESSLNEMEVTREELKKMKQDYAATLSVWVKRIEIEQFIETICETADCVYDTGSFLLGSPQSTVSNY